MTVLDASSVLAQPFLVATKETIDTAAGRVWITYFDSGDASLWTPPGSRQSNVVADIVAGRAAWKPKYRAWMIPSVHVQDVIEELQKV